MKKLISILLILCMVFAVVACDKDSGDSADTYTNPSGEDSVKPDENKVPGETPELPYHNDYKAAVWEGYTGSSFIEFLNTAMEKYKEVEPDVEATIHKISTKEGWKNSDTLDENVNLSEGCEAITYIIEASEDGTDADIYVFMEYDESDDTISVKGGLVEGNHITNAYTKEEAEVSLNVAKALLENKDALKVEVAE